MKKSLIFSLRNLILISIAIESGINVSAQGFIIYGDKTFGTPLNEYIHDMKILSYSNCLYFVGRANPIIAGDKADSSCSLIEDFWLVKTDLQLNKFWDRAIGGNNAENWANMFIDSQGQIIISGSSLSDSSCEKSENARGSNIYYDYWVVAYDTNGFKLWDKTLGGSAHDKGGISVQLTSGNYITCGESNSPVGFDKSVANWGGSDYWCVKHDGVGNKIWDQIFGGDWAEIAGQGYSFIIADDNDSFILAGSTSSPVSGNISQPKFDVLSNLYDIWIIKIDSLGNKIWDRRYGGNHTDILSGNIKKTSDGYMLVGRTLSQLGGSISQPPIGTGFNEDVWVLKLDTAGYKIWDRRYGGTGSDAGAWIEEAIDGGYLISANTNSPSGNDITEPPYGNQNGDYWIFKIDTSGNKLWDKRFGGPGANRVANFVQMSDSSIYLFGVADSGTTAAKTDPGKGSLDYWIIHFKYTNGPTGIDETVYGNGHFSLSPNPATTQLTLQYSPPKTTGRATVFNSTGSKVSEINLPKNSHSQQLDISPYSSGLYLLKIETESYTGAKKFFKL